RSRSAPPRRTAGPRLRSRPGRGAASSPAPKARWKPPSSTRTRLSRGWPCPAQPSSHAHHHLPGRTRLADRDRRARRHLVPGELARKKGGSAMTDTDAVQSTAGQFTAQEQEWVDAFLAETTLFLGPDPQIMNDHRMAPR